MNLTIISPTCSCCEQPTTLLPREDLGPGLAVCGRSGQLYRPADESYVPMTLPPIVPRSTGTTSVQIDLSRSGYA